MLHVKYNVLNYLVIIPYILCLANEYVGVTTLSTNQCTIQKEKTPWWWYLHKMFYMTGGHSLFLSLSGFRLPVTQKLLLCVSTRVFTGNNGTRLNSKSTKTSSIEVIKMREKLDAREVKFAVQHVKKAFTEVVIESLQTSSAALPVEVILTWSPWVDKINFSVYLFFLHTVLTLSRKNPPSNSRTRIHISAD